MSSGSAMSWRIKSTARESRADFLAGVQNGVYGTPGLFLNGVRYDGEPGKESLRSLLTNGRDS